mmetsp:Transcript_29766/g.45364  ORF Transcript_29766/g.45364 Transcript_29766/m.45364 type:complete len:239 (-) Transcript_29766:960-1676(-)
MTSGLSFQISVRKDSETSRSVMAIEDVASISACCRHMSIKMWRAPELTKAFLPFAVTIDTLKMSCTNRRYSRLSLVALRRWLVIISTKLFLPNCIMELANCSLKSCSCLRKQYMSVCRPDMLSKPSTSSCLSWVFCLLRIWGPAASLMGTTSMNQSQSWLRMVLEVVWFSVYVYIVLHTLLMHREQMVARSALFESRPTFSTRKVMLRAFGSWLSSSSKSMSLPVYCIMVLYHITSFS